MNVPCDRASLKTCVKLKQCNEFVSILRTFASVFPSFLSLGLIPLAM